MSSHERTQGFATLTQRGTAVALGLLLTLVTITPSITSAATDTESAAGSVASPPINVLMLYTESRLGPGVVALDEAFRSALESQVRGPVYFYTEYLDLSLFVGNVPQRELRDLLIRKYSGRKIDLVLAVASRALRIAVQARGELFLGVPIVFAAVAPSAIGDLSLGPDVTGTHLNMSWAETLDVALRLRPTTRRVVVLTGSGPQSRVYLEAAHAQLAAYRDRLEITYLTDLRFADVLARVAALPADTVVLLGSFSRDADNRDLTVTQVAREIATTARAPVYALNESLIGTGVVGGHVTSFRQQGLRSAEMAARVLRGERPAPSGEGTNAYVFDGRQLERWSIDERGLPPGSVVRFRQPSMWEMYRWYIVSTISVIALQAALIAGLLVSRAQRRRAQQALRERLRFETVLGDLSATFAALDVGKVDEAMTEGLRRIGLELDVDRAILVRVEPRASQCDVTHFWTRETFAPRPMSFEMCGFPWISEQIQKGRTVSFPRPHDLPREAATDAASLATLGIGSLLLVPFVVGGAGGSIGLVTYGTTRQWSDEVVQRVRLLAEVFANALERRRAANAMHESEGRFRLLAETIPLMIWVSLPDGRRTYFNHRWLQVTGCQLEAALGDGWLTLVHPDDRDHTAKAMHVAVERRGPFTVDYRLQRDGSGRHGWVVDHGVPSRGADGTFVGYIGAIVDVSELRKTQEALAQSNALRSAIFGSLYGHVVAIDREGTILAVNDAWLRLAEARGVDPVRVSEGANYFSVCQQVTGMSDADQRRSAEAVSRVLLGTEPRAHLEYHARAGGGDRWFEVMAEPFQRAEGGAVVSHVDVTRRRQAEDEAQHQREELAHTLRITTLGMLAASLAHEINQPLAAIVTNAQATIRMLDAAAPGSDIREALIDVVADGNRASETIRRLRTLFRREPVPSPRLNVNDLTAETLGLMHDNFRRKRIGVVCTYDPALPMVSGDPVHLQQVLLILLVNASEAIVEAGDGSREITITTGSRDPGRVEVCISDTGLGVKSSDLAGMFERFVTTKREGLGMGLAISRSIVQAHGGKIWASATVPRGLTVHVELPTQDPL